MRADPVTGGDSLWTDKSMSTQWTQNAEQSRSSQNERLDQPLLEVLCFCISEINCLWHLPFLSHAECREAMA